MAHPLLNPDPVGTKLSFIAALVAAALAVSIVVPARATPASVAPLSFHAEDVQGRPFDLAQLRGQIVVVTFGSRSTIRESRAINRRLDPLVEPGRVAVVTVVDLAEVPSLFLGYARRRVREATASSRIEYVIDDRGRLCRALAVEATEILVVDRAGFVRRRLRGEAAVDEALRTVDWLNAVGGDISGPTSVR